MGSYSLLIKPSALKELEAVATVRLRRRLVSSIQSLSAMPRGAGCEKLVGGERYRIRRGPYRVVYEIDDRLLTVTVVKIGHRKDVYR